MTVCIAARAGPNLIGASDRMLTSGDIQFEPPHTSKLINPTNSLALMQAGDAALNTEILVELNQFVIDRVKTDPDTWVRVSAAAPDFWTAG